MARPLGKKDSKPRATPARKAAAKWSGGKPTPLEIILAVMHKRWEANDFDGAVAAAEKAAPYCHSKLAPLQPGNPEGDNAIVVRIVGGLPDVSTGA